MRKLARLETVSAVSPIENADKIEKVEVGGWQCVTGKGNFSVGDRCLYFEPDAALPIDHPAFAFLAARSTRQLNGRTVHVLRTVKLRGEFSQGLVLPLRDFDLGAFGKEISSLQDGEDFSEILGVEKWEPPITTIGGVQAGSFPSHLIKKTDSERVQNLVGVWDTLRAEGEWVWTEKIDGTSMTVIRDKETLRVCSRNYELVRSENVYWSMVDKCGLDALLQGDGDFVQGEISGPGIQGNPLGLKEVKLFVFAHRVSAWPASTFFDNYRTMASSILLGAPVINVAELPATVKDALEFADGLKSALDNSRLAEGIVFHHPAGKTFRALGDRSTFKAVSRAYESKQKNR